MKETRNFTDGGTRWYVFFFTSRMIVLFRPIKLSNTGGKGVLF